MIKYFTVALMTFVFHVSIKAELKVNNCIIPVSFFTNHIKQISLIKNNLDKYRNVGLFGVSGIGKTQIVRMYSYENKDNYDLIWFFDCYLDINDQFVRLAKELNVNMNANISEDSYLAKKEIMHYLSSKNRWLLVFDNLKTDNNIKIHELINWEYNGHVIFCSQNSEKLPYVIQIKNLEKEDSISLVNKVLDSMNSEDIEFLSSEFSGYPILIVQGAQLINKVKGLNKKEYKKKIHESSDKIKVNIDFVIKDLNKSARDLLYKIVLINNQLFSKNLLSIITDNKNTLDDDIYHLSKFSFISNVDSEEQNPTFEMHDIIANKILELAENSQKKKILEDIVTRIINAIPASLQQGHIFRTSKTIRQNIEVISRNATKYNMSVNKLMELNQIVLVNYINTLNYDMSEVLINWFRDIDNKGDFNLLLMNQYEKYIYSRYLITMGGYYRLIARDYLSAISYFVKAKQILDNLNIDGRYEKKYNLLYQLASSQTALGMLEEANSSINELESMTKLELVEKSNNSVMYLAKARLFKAMGNFVNALEEVNKDISESIKYGLKENDLLFTSTYLLKSEILNYLGRYNDSIIQIEYLLDMHKSKKGDHIIFGSIYTQIARVKLGLKDYNSAVKYSSQAVKILSPKIKTEISETRFSSDIELAKSYTVLADTLLATNKYKDAVKNYEVAEGMYRNIYGDNVKEMHDIVHVILNGAKSSCIAKDKFWSKHFYNSFKSSVPSNNSDLIELNKLCKEYID